MTRASREGTKPMASVEHVDARDLAQFEGMNPADKLREIWLNGRETNGSVADAKRDIAVVQREHMEIVERVSELERNYLKVATLGAAALFVGPFVFWALLKWFGG